MPSPVAVARISIVRFGEPDRSVWCDGCLLPSAESQRFAATSGLAVYGVFRVTVCHDCGRYSTVRCQEEDL